MRRTVAILLSIAALDAGVARSGPKPIRLRVMTYILHSCKGMDGRVRPERIAAVVERYHPDVVALQEVRVGRVERSGSDRPHPTSGAVMEPPVGEPPLSPPSVIAPRRPSDTAPSKTP